MVSPGLAMTTGWLSLFQPKWHWWLWVGCVCGLAFPGCAARSANKGPGVGSRGPFRWNLLSVLGEDVVVVHRDVDRIGVENGLAPQPGRMVGEADLVEDRRPRRIPEHVVENALPHADAFGLLVILDHGVG